MTVAELNLRTGDRIQSGDRFGTFLGKDYENSDSYTTYYNVQWDWDSRPTRYHNHQEVQWVALARPEPTLASLKLKAGDPVLVGKTVLLVGEIDDEVLTFTDHLGSPISYQLVVPLSKFTQIKKLEVPK